MVIQEQIHAFLLQLERDDFQVTKKKTILSYHAETFILPRKLKTVTMTAYPLKHEHKIPL